MAGSNGSDCSTGEFDLTESDQRFRVMARQVELYSGAIQSRYALHVMKGLDVSHLPKILIVCLDPVMYQRALDIATDTVEDEKQAAGDCAEFARLQADRAMTMDSYVVCVLYAIEYLHDNDQRLLRYLLATTSEAIRQQLVDRLATVVFRCDFDFDIAKFDPECSITITPPTSSKSLVVIDFIREVGRRKGMAERAAYIASNIACEIEKKTCRDVQNFVAGFLSTSLGPKAPIIPHSPGGKNTQSNLSREERKN